MISAKAVGPSGDHSDLVVEALDGTVGDFTFGPEPIENKFLVGAEHAGDLAHGLDTTAQSAFAPDIQEGSGPSEGSVGPEVMESFLEHPGSGGGQFGMEKSVEFLLGVAADAAATAQQFPAHVFELGGLRSAAQLAALGAAHLIDGLVEVGGDVEAVQDMQGVGDLGGQDAQVGLPHVATDKTQAADDLRSEHGQPPAQGRLGPTWSHPKQTAAVAVDLVNDGQEVFGAQSLAPVDLVDAEGFEPFELAMRQAPLDKPVYGAVDGLPTGLEGPGRFAPRQAAGPAGQEDHHGDGDRAFAGAPGNVLDAQAVLRALDSTRGVVEVRWDVPQGRKKPGTFGQPIVARGGALALSTLAVHGRVRLQMDVNVQGRTVVPEPDRPVDEARERLNPVQDGLNVQLNSWSPGREFVCLEHPQITRTFWDQLFVSGLVNRPATCDAADALAEDRALRGRNPSADQSLQTAEGPDGRFTPIVRSHHLQEQSQSEKSTLFHPQILLQSHILSCRRRHR